MAILYKVTFNGELISLQTIFNKRHVVKSSPREIAFSIENKDAWKQTDIAKLQAESQSYDIFHASCEQAFQPHWHSDFEQRLIINGSGRFYIPHDNQINIVECFPGDLLWIGAGVVHWFYSDSSITAARFFSNNNGHICQTSMISPAIISYFSEHGDSVCTKI